LKNFSKENDILIQDLLPYFNKYKAEVLLASPTYHHPNEIMHDIVTKALYNFIINNKLIDK